jgi:hypothetical protein
MTDRLSETRWAPWAGLFIGPAAWALHHQIGSDLAYFECSQTHRWIGLAVGIACLSLVLAATWLSWISRTRGQASPQSVEMRRFVGWLATASGLFFAFAILLQSLIPFLAPLCAS